MAVFLYESSYYGVSPLGIEIEHHGIKGQKWYQRRFQNEDGTLTALGRLRYGVGEARKRYKELKESQAEKKRMADEERFQKSKERAIETGDTKFLNEYRDRLTNDELTKALVRVKLNKSLSELTPPSKSISEIVNGILITGTNTMNTIANLKDAHSKLVKAFEDPDEAEESKLKKEMNAELRKAENKSIAEAAVAAAKKARGTTEGDAVAKEIAAKKAFDAVMSVYKDKLADSKETKRSFDEFIGDVKSKASSKENADSVKRSLGDFLNDAKDKASSVKDKTAPARQKIGDVLGKFKSKTDSATSAFSNATDSYSSVFGSLSGTYERERVKSAVSSTVSSSSKTKLSDLFKRKTSSASSSVSGGKDAVSKMWGEVSNKNKSTFEASLDFLNDLDKR